MSFNLKNKEMKYFEINQLFMTKFGIEANLIVEKKSAIN